MNKLSGLISMVKNTFEVTYEELKVKPQLMDPDEAGLKHLEKDVIEAAEFSADGARKAADKYLKGKFFPRELRPKIWPLLMENKHHINSRLYKAYADSVDKKLKEDDSYGTSQCNPRKHSVHEEQHQGSPRQVGAPGRSSLRSLRTQDFAGLRVIPAEYRLRSWSREACCLLQEEL